MHWLGDSAPLRGLSLLVPRRLQHVRQAVVRLVARELVHAVVRARQRESPAPLPRERRRVVDRELVAQRVGPRERQDSMTRR